MTKSRCQAAHCGKAAIQEYKLANHKTDLTETSALCAVILCTLSMKSEVGLHQVTVFVLHAHTNTYQLSLKALYSLRGQRSKINTQSTYFHWALQTRSSVLHEKRARFPTYCRNCEHVTAVPKGQRTRSCFFISKYKLSSCNDANKFIILIDFYFSIR